MGSRGPQVKKEACVAFGADDAHPSRAAADAMVFTVAALQARLRRPPAPARRDSPADTASLHPLALQLSLSTSCLRAPARSLRMRLGRAWRACTARDALRHALRDRDGRLRVLRTPA